MDTDATLTQLEQAQEKGGAEQVFAQMIATLREEKRLAEVFDVLQMQARHRYGLPLLGNLDLAQLPADTKKQLDEDFLQACRRTGELFLESGDIPGAWPYFHKLQDYGPVGDALEQWTPGGSDDTPIEVLIQIGYAQGAHPARGYQLLVQNRGTCDGISMLEQSFPFGPSIKEQCVGHLVRYFHEELRVSLVRELGDSATNDDAEADLATLLERHGTKLGQSCPVDDSHLQAVLRFSVALTGPEELALANQIADYGALLAQSYSYSEKSPFQDYYRDYRIFLRGLTGVEKDANTAVDHFRAKLQLEGAPQFAAEVFVYLLHRVGRDDEAIATFREHLGSASSLSISPTLYDLCASAGDGAALCDKAQATGSLVEYAAGLLI